MADAQMSAKFVRVQIKEGKTGIFLASSRDLQGLLVVEPTLPDLHRAIPEAIRQMYAACGIDVVVTVADPIDADRAWVAVPPAVIPARTLAAAEAD